jgi:formylglycine-generating enzyme required for sulfatase activity
VKPSTIVLAVLGWGALAAGVAFGQRPRFPEGKPGTANLLVRALDRDGDDQLSAEEIANAPAVLRKLDRNGDGRLSREELRPQGGGDRRPGGSERRPEPRRSVQSQRPADPAPEGSRPARASQVAPGPVSGFVQIPAGEFDMGDHHDLGGGEHSNDEVPIHRVRLDSFSISTTETTNEQYCAFLNAALAQGLIEVREGLVYGKGSKFLYCDTHASDEASSIELRGGKFSIVDHRANHPAVCIRWHGAAAYCNWLSREKGYDLCYDADTWQCDYTKRGFRLPTEAEWEHAGRGGLCGPYYIFPWGSDPDLTKANWPRSGDPYEIGPYPWTTPVGFYNGKLHRKADFHWPGEQESYQTADGSNGYGLHDMAGNVWEWTGDWYDHDYYAASPAANPHGPDQGQPMRDGTPYRTLRSGSWYNGQWGLSRLYALRPQASHPDLPHRQPRPGRPLLEERI